MVNIMAFSRLFSGGQAGIGEDRRRLFSSLGTGPKADASSADRSSELLGRMRQTRVDLERKAANDPAKNDHVYVNQPGLTNQERERRRGKLETRDTEAAEMERRSRERNEDREMVMGEAAKDRSSKELIETQRNQTELTKQGMANEGLMAVAGLKGGMDVALAEVGGRIQEGLLERKLLAEQEALRAGREKALMEAQLAREEQTIGVATTLATNESKERAAAASISGKLPAAGDSEATRFLNQVLTSGRQAAPGQQAGGEQTEEQRKAALIDQGKAAYAEMPADHPQREKLLARLKQLGVTP